MEKKYLFKINLDMKMPCSFNINQNKSLLNNTLENPKLALPKKKEANFIKNEERKEITNDFLGKKVRFNIQKEIGLQGNKIFNITRYRKKAQRWNKIEKFKFLEVLYFFGGKWKVIKKHIKSRSDSQVRSYAQTFFLKLRKFNDDSLGIDFTKDSNKNNNEILKKLKEIIDNSKYQDILYILSQKLSKEKKVKNKRKTKNNTYIDNILSNFSSKIPIKGKYLNSIVSYAHDANININEAKDISKFAQNLDYSNSWKELKLNNINLKNNINEAIKEKYEENERNTASKDHENNGNELSSTIQNKIDLNDCCLNQNYSENIDNSFNNNNFGQKSVNNEVLFSSKTLEEINNYWNFNCNILENEKDENSKEAFETNSFNFLKNFFDN